MPNAYHDIAFTGQVKDKQTAFGSRDAYARYEDGAEVTNTVITPAEAAFIAAQDSFYMATVSETGWPYVQHRGGPAGFLKVVDDRTLGFADFRGNRQYVSLGNIGGEDRVSIFLMDYANRRRLKIFGRASVIGGDDDRLERLVMSAYRAPVERGWLIAVEAFEWNCPAHITQRFTLGEVQAATGKLAARVAELEAELARLKGS